MTARIKILSPRLLLAFVLVIPVVLHSPVPVLSQSADREYSQPQAFKSEPIAEFPRLEVSAAATADLNGDGRSEILAATDQNLSVIGGIPDQISIKPACCIPSGTTALAASDLNFDGRTDLAGISVRAAKTGWVAFGASATEFNAAHSIALESGVNKVYIVNAPGGAEQLIVFSTPTALYLWDLKTPERLKEIILPLGNAEFSIVGAGDFAGDGRRQLIGCTDGPYCRLVRIDNDKADFLPWAEFPMEFFPAAGVIGDFAGSSADEFLAFDQRLTGWWIVWSLRGQGLEYPMSGLPRLTGDSQIFAAKFSGQSRTEVLILEAKKSFVLYRPQLTSIAVHAGHKPEEIGRAINVSETAAEQTDAGPYVCIAYTPSLESKWGLRYRDDCPRNYAYYASQDNSGVMRRPENSQSWGTCCRVPADDILLGQTAEVEARCPEDFVAIGTRTDSECVTCVHRMTCRKINTDRYQLGPETPGGYWGIGMNMKVFGKNFHEEDIPLAIRYGITRVSYSNFDSDGCIGDPPGSLLVRKGKRCIDQKFRRLEYKGINGDPPQGTPVAMFPDCALIDNIYDPSAGCLAAASAVRK